MTSVLIKGHVNIYTDTEGRKPHDDKSRAWTEATTSPRTAEIAG